MWYNRTINKTPLHFCGGEGGPSRPRRNTNLLNLVGFEPPIWPPLSDSHSCATIGPAFGSAEDSNLLTLPFQEMPFPLWPYAPFQRSDYMTDILRNVKVAILS